MKVKIYSVLVILFWMLISIYPCYKISDLQYDFDTSALSPESSSEKEFYLKFQEKFNIKGEYLSIAFINDGSIFEESFLLKCQRFSDSLKHLDYHTEFLSPLELRYMVNGVFSAQSKKLINLKQADKLSTDSAYIYDQIDLVPAFFNLKSDAFCINLKLKDDYNSKQLAKDIANIRSWSGLTRIVTLGGDSHKSELEMQLKEDVWKTALVAASLCFFFLLLFYRNLILSFVLGALTVLASAWSYGLMAIFDVPVNTLSSMIPAIVLCIALSDLVHFNQTFRHYIAEGKAKVTALIITLKEIARANFITSLSTCLGFLTLLLSGSQAFTDFAIFISIGIAIAYLLSISLFPAILLVLPVGRLRLNYFDWLPRLPLNKATSLLLSIGLLGLICSIPLATQNNFLLQGKNDKNQLTKDTRYFDENFGGIRSIELEIEIPEGAIPRDQEVVLDLGIIDDYLRDSLSYNKVYSLISMLKAANRSLYFGKSEAYKLPDNPRDMTFCKKSIFDERQNPGLKDFVSDQSLRVVAFSQDFGSKYFRSKHRQLKQFLDQKLSSKGYSWRITGYPEVLDKSAFHFLLKIAGSLLIGLIIVLLLIKLAYASWSLALAALLANMFPLLLFNLILVLSGVGYDFTLTTILIISFGMAVDDTIHFINRYKLEIKQGQPRELAIQNTLKISGKAILLTSILLIVGFGALSSSALQLTRTFGSAAALVLLFALLSDLLILPYLIRRFESD